MLPSVRALELNQFLPNNRLKKSKQLENSKENFKENF
jgi:hypothetical protein